MAPKKHSGFMMFVNEWRDNNPQSRKMTLAQAVTHCGELWKNLTLQQRGPYNSSAKDADVQARATRERLNCYGQAISDVEHAQREVTESLLLMKRSIERIVMDAKRSHELESTKFVFCAFNYFTKAFKTDVYVPAEFAACEYSLKDGIISVYSTLIDPGHIIFGQASDAQHHSSTTHGLPLPPKALGEGNMAKLYSQIVEYLTKCHGDKALIVFTPTEMMAMVKSCIRFLACESEDSQGDSEKIIVYDIQYLLFILKKEVLHIAGLPDDKINIYVTDSIFLRDFFEFTPEIACQFHEENDRSKYCTQSMVKRWAFIFSDFMCGDLAITVQPGKHIPPKTRPNYRITPADSLSLTRESSFNSFYSLPELGAKHDNKHRNTSPTGSLRSNASSAYVPTDHTAFASDLNKATEFPTLGGRRPKGRRTPADGAVQRDLGAWNLPAHPRSINEFSDDDFNVTGAGKKKGH